MLLLEKVEISFSSGLNVFTGETGAGKSIILECLGFVLGKKSRTRFLRTSCESGEVVAEFMVNETGEIKELLDSLSIEWSSTLIIRRVEFSDGKRKTYINDISCTLETVQKIGAELIEFVDQKDGSVVLKKGNHINLLDDFSGHKKQVNSLLKNWELLKRTESEIAIMEAKTNTLKEEIEFIEHSLLELKNLNPKLGEVSELEELQSRLRSSSRINEYLQGAATLISEAHVRDDLVIGLSKLEKACHLLPNNKLLLATITSLEGLIHELDEIEKNISSILRERANEEFTLEEVEDRLFNLKNIARKHRVKPEDLLSLSNDLEDKLLSHTDSEGKMRNLRKQLSSVEKAYQADAEAISEKRKVEGKKLEIMMQQELFPLKMEGIVFKTFLEERKVKGFNGLDTVTFKISNHGMTPKDLDKVASGGELSRLLLALKVCLKSNIKRVVMIFDEIDRGIGGATAEAVGIRLGMLAKQDQILLVTHSPQVASKANRHWRVRKVSNKKSGPLTLLDELNQKERVAELARMISGEVVSKEALAAAYQLLN